MVKSIIICALSVFAFSNNLLSQDLVFFNEKIESYYLQPLDTALLLSDTPVKSPWGAVIRSAVLPGWGQLYNHHYVKAGLALSLNSFLAYHIYWYEKKWRDTKNKDFQGKRNLYSWYFTLGYLLTMVDAYVDAYLFEFDKAMNISQRLDVKEGSWLVELQLSIHF